jgi:hypothetical protein
MVVAAQPQTKPRTSSLVDADEVCRALSILLEPGQITELRALHALSTASPRYRSTLSGYFTEPEALVRAAASITSAKGIYITLNPCKRGLITRAYNRLRTSEDMKWDSRTTQDTEILYYRWLPVDIDPVRYDGNDSSSEPEHNAALALARHVRDALHEELGWPIFADSGNGAHLLYPLPDAAREVAEPFIQHKLITWASHFNTTDAKIDTGVFNPSRIWKLYGSKACKGDDVPEWPHRMSRILDEGTPR